MRPRAYGHCLLSRRVRARILTHSHLQEAILNVANNGERPDAFSELSQVSTKASSICSSEGSLDQVTGGSRVESESVSEANSYVSSGGSFALELAEYVSNSGESTNGESSSGGSFALPASPCQLLAGPFFVSGGGSRALELAVAGGGGGGDSVREAILLGGGGVWEETGGTHSQAFDPSGMKLSFNRPG